MNSTVILRNFLSIPIVFEKSMKFKKYQKSLSTPTVYANANFLMQKIILGQTQGHFSTCSSLKIGLNLDRSTCWRERKGAGNKCNVHISLDSNRKCLDRVRDNALRGGAQVDLFTLSIYTGISDVLLNIPHFLK